jgi:vitamin B12 transporter
MNIKKLSLAAAVSALTFTTASNAVLGPIPIYLNTEYRTSNPVIGSIASKIVINKEEIEQSGANTFTELLGSLSAVSFEGGQGNLTALRIRGNEASHTLLLVDGSKITITGGQPNIDIVPLDQIEHIEITKGPFSSLYGPGAIGGVIHIFTNKKSKPGTHSKISFSYGTHNSKKVSISSSINNQSNYVNYTLSDYHTDGIDAKNDGDLDPIDRTSGSLNIGTTISDTTNVKLNVLKTNSDIEYDDSFSTPKPDNNLTQFNIELNHQFNEKLATKFNYTKQDTKRRGDKYKLDTLAIVNELELDNGKLSIGASNTVDKDVKNSKQIKHTDLFSQWQGVYKDNELSIGARIVDHDKFNNHNTYNINWAKDVNDGARLTAAFGKATNLPNHYQNNLNIENGKTELKPEHSKSLEFGVSKNYMEWDLSAKIYKSKTTDAFKWSATGYTNDGTVNIKGLELTLNRELLNWDIDINYDYNTAVKESTNLQKGRRPNHTASITATNKNGKYNNRINIIGKSWAWDKDAHTDNDKLGGYGIVNLFSSYDYNKQTSVSISLNNALDKKYEMAKGYNTLGRTITLGVTHSF